MKKTLVMFLLFCPLLLFAQEKIIQGTVVDEYEMPIMEATVMVKNSMRGVSTDEDGHFEIKAKPNDVLVFLFIGFKRKEILVGDQSTIKVLLEEEIDLLNEVVVTGYQEIEERKLTSAVSKVKLEDVNQIGVSSVDILLQGQAPGVVVAQQTGSPGTISRIRIRGTASLSGPQDPLWVVDGLPLEGNDVPDFTDKDNIDQLKNYSIAGINPDDVEDITILRDAAATAIYGARASNGVIVVTTKKGKKGQMRVNFSANTFYSMRPAFSKLNLMSGAEKVDFELGLAQRTDLDFRSNQGAIMRILNDSGELGVFRSGGFSALSNGTQSAINNLKATQTNWGNLLYQAAVNSQYSLSVSGGGEFSDYYFSLGLYDEEGTTIGTGFKRYNVTLKNNYQLSDKIDLGVTLLGSHSKKDSYITGTDAFTNPSNYSRNANPYLSPFNEDGTYQYDQDINGFEGRYVPFNFLEERENTSYDLKNNALKAIVDASYKFTDDLKLSTQLGLQLDKNSTEKYAGTNSYFTRKVRERSRRYDSSIGDYYYFLPEGGIIQNIEDSFFQYNWKSLLEYSTTIANQHEIEAMIGSELRKTYGKTVVTQGFGYNPKTLTTTPIIFPNEDTANEANYKTYQRGTTENAYTSFYATGSYTYDRRYTVFGSVRYDGSNLFGVDPKYKYLPLWSASAAWRVSEENFLKNNTTLSNLRLRASYGLQGNIDRNTSPFVVGAYGQASLLPNTNEDAITVTSPPNGKLRWEKTENYNLGADIGLFNNRINLGLDFYTRKSSDLIGLKSIALENGFEFTNLNWAQVSNKGFEISFSTKNIVTEDFKWTTNFNIAHNKSNVDKIKIRENSFFPSREGLPVNAVFALKTAGLDEDGYPMFWKGDEKVSAVEFFDLYDPWADFFPGYLSQSNLSTEDFRNLFTYVGDRDPKYSGGIINTIKYKNFDLSASVSFNLQQTVTENLPYNPTQVDRGQNYTRDILNAWSPTNTGSNLPAIVGETSGTGDSWMAYKWFSGGNPINTMAYLDTYVKKISYARVSSIRLGYSLPNSVTSKLNIQKFRFNLEGRNLFVIGSDYSGYFDPETYGNIYAQPIPRSIALGVNVSF
ncbi:SusC/RagA family TonB-linked outer membrane protein [Tenacibaculum sp. IB213877]|uniref:SusC/RagA family TonB-linked outer membrane protein n=1 Tax=Tenacibaculum sp. IB213877 TaxID=3097351 RepID=UPI002A5ACB82|nr:SusC/RagA family TonB-linked outer membrane protein [Tenacibaculum sp. IB213877]MDY0781233.1 SusC/RagA family TonB-linked outer membrane protein [Tenacibaculum sp. IB213877]